MCKRYKRDGYKKQRRRIPDIEDIDGYLTERKKMKQRTLKIIISPAKKMKEKDILDPVGLPVFLEQTEKLLSHMRRMSKKELQSVWKCNDSIAEENYERVCRMNIKERLTPAILSYEGIQYKYMAPAVFDENAYAYLENHLYILSGFYGALKPFDGVTPYRLEMQARFQQKSLDSLYEFWGNRIAKEVLKECGCLVNLASKEYSKTVLKYLPEPLPCITCVFGERTGGKIKEKGTYAKMARGGMVRFMAENKIESPGGMKDFQEYGYRFSEDDSDGSRYVFLRQD